MIRKAPPVPVRGVVSTTAVLATLSFAPLAWPVDGAHATWSIASAVLGITAQYALMSVLVRQHLGAVSRGAAVDGACSATAHAALLVLVLEGVVQTRSGGSAAAADLLLVLVATGVVVAATGVACLVLTRTRRDERLAAACYAGIASGSACIGELLGAIRLVGGAGQLSWVCAITASVLLVRAASSPPAPPLPGLREAPRIEVAGCTIAGLEAIGVVLWAQWHVVPSVAVLLAVVALLAVLVKLLLVVGELMSLKSFEEAALVDDLTELPNRLAAQRGLDAARSAGRRGCVLLFGLDGFHVVNDVLGRAVGDLVLLGVAARLVEACELTEGLARVGGDVFLAFVPGDDVDHASSRATAIREALAATMVVDGHSVDVRSSVGMCVTTCSEPSNGEIDALHGAELALRHARETRQSFVVYGPEMHDAMSRRLDLEVEVRAAFCQEEFVLHFQPQVDSAGNVQGAEALVRWQHPTRGIVPPDDFLPLVAELGLQSELTAWVLTNALEEAACWHAAGRQLTIAVNISAGDLDHLLVDLVLEQLGRTGLPADHLVLEITETTLVLDPQHAAEVLTALTELGVRTSIDDYGTGYSPLTLLLRLPVSELKLDRSFVSRLLTDERSRVLVEATVELAHRLEMRVVAEGVEDHHVLEALHEMRCDLTQGWVHHRAVPGAQFRSWLDGHPGSTKPATALPAGGVLAQT